MRFDCPPWRHPRARPCCLGTDRGPRSFLHCPRLPRGLPGFRRSAHSSLLLHPLGCARLPIRQAAQLNMAAIQLVAGCLDSTCSDLLLSRPLGLLVDSAAALDAFRSAEVTRRAVSPNAGGTAAPEGGIGSEAAECASPTGCEAGAIGGEVAEYDLRTGGGAAGHAPRGPAGSSHGPAGAGTMGFAPKPSAPGRDRASGILNLAGTTGADSEAKAGSPARRRQRPRRAGPRAS